MNSEHNNLHLADKINEMKAKYKQLSIRSEEIQRELTKLVDEKDDVERAIYKLKKQIEELTKNVRP